MKIVVLGGGISTERHVALVTATSVCKALRSLGHQAIFVDMFLGLENYDGPLEEAFNAPDGFCGQVAIEHAAPDLEKVKASRKLKGPSRLGKDVLSICQLADCVFLGLHGADGEDGKIQAALELLGVPYTGSGPLGSAIAMDKAMAKRVIESCGVRTPAWQELCYTREDIPRLTESLPVPCAVKVVDGGSSIGVALPDTREELRSALEDLLQYGSRMVVEEKIRGRELTVPVLDGRALSPIEIVPPEGNSFDYVAKYQSGDEGAREICPAPITEREKALLCEAAVRVHEGLGLSVYSRSDFVLDEDGNAWWLEVNTLPGMTPNSLIPKAAAVEGMSYAQLCQKIVELSLGKNGKADAC
ncbi:MAG: D-alanine--D-alanine ligase [Oscillospiraceae bacterium]|nr:D-alanine--D-alanine ligase [Oscillospiraceae bacterium]